MGWNLEEHDENQLVLLFDLALTRCPQLVRRGDDEVVIVSIEEYERLGGKKPGFIEHLLSIPHGEDLDLTRVQIAMRDVDFSE
ncbi:MAG: type II toxin-antitoxin system Phd/YefM family antitoxin [Chloroflexota bacterium]|nr:type II toxin-antitoxin system Phd/YefM family antitoxin [Chloroflexota bacterium]